MFRHKADPPSSSPSVPPPVFAVGEVVEMFDNAGRGFLHTVTIAGPPFISGWRYEGEQELQPAELCYPVEERSRRTGSSYGVPARFLRKRQREDLTKVSWSKCIWRPLKRTPS